MGLLVNRVLRPDNYSIAIEFNEDTLAWDSNYEIAMWCFAGNAAEASRGFPITSNAMNFDPRWARYANLNSIPAIKASQYFNRYEEYPNCLIIEFDNEVSGGQFGICWRFLLSPTGPVEEEYYTF